MTYLAKRKVRTRTGNNSKMVFILFLDALRRESGRFAGRSRRDDNCSRETEHIGRVIFIPLTEEVKRNENSNYMFIAENDKVFISISWF